MPPICKVGKHKCRSLANLPSSNYFFIEVDEMLRRFSVELSYHHCCQKMFKLYTAVVTSNVNKEGKPYFKVQAFTQNCINNDNHPC